MQHHPPACTVAAAKVAWVCLRMICTCQKVYLLLRCVDGVAASLGLQLLCCNLT
jgi:hypothetical protein